MKRQADGRRHLAAAHDVRHAVLRQQDLCDRQRLLGPERASRHRNRQNKRQAFFHVILPAVAAHGPSKKG